jgi:hypothetical protein
VSTPPDEPAPPVSGKTAERIVVSGTVDKRRPAPPPRRMGTWLLVAATVALAAWRHDDVFAWLAPPRRDIGPDRPPVDESPLPKERAAELRRTALAQCDAMSWFACVAGLDSARELDPAGDADPRVQAARQRILESFGPLDGAPTKPK